jgi:hypothetical protein
MWTFRRWFLSRNYTVEQYTDLQIAFILGQQCQTLNHIPLKSTATGQTKE